MGKQYVVWTYSNGDLEYSLEESKEDAFDLANVEDDSDWTTLRGVEAPDGSDITEEYEAWRKARRSRAVEPQDPPRPRVATIAVASKYGLACIDYYDQAAAAKAHTEAVMQFGSERVTLTEYPPKVLVWVGTYERKEIVDYDQKKINDSREAFGKPILKEHVSYKDEFSTKREWREGNGAVQLLEYSTEKRKVVVSGADKVEVELAVERYANELPA